MTYLLVIILLAAIFYLLLVLPTQWFKVARIRYPAGIGIRAVQISDIHVENLRVSPGRIRRVIEREKPDCVFLTGDFTQMESRLPDVRKFLERALVPGIPAYAVLGNHDYRLDSRGMKKLAAIIREAGVELLLNRSVMADGYQIVGIDDYGTKHSKPAKAFRDADPDVPAIVITHDPNVIDHIDHPYAYLMAGHFHGMQFYIPFLFRFINKGEVAKRGIIQGLHNVKGRTVYISAGIGQTDPNARLFIRSEVTVHEL